MPADSYATQSQLNTIADWTDNNLMKLNAAKYEYMIFGTSEEDFATRLVINDTKLDRVNVAKTLGVWISDDLSWARHVTEI